LLALPTAAVVSATSDNAHVLATVVEMVRTETIDVVSVALALQGLAVIAIEDEFARSS
jgi:hypothetical protein